MLHLLPTKAGQLGQKPKCKRAARADADGRVAAPPARSAPAAGARFVDLALLQPAWPMRTAGDDSGQREVEFENAYKLMGNVCKLMVSVLKRWTWTMLCLKRL